MQSQSIWYGKSDAAALIYGPLFQTREEQWVMKIQCALYFEPELVCSAVLTQNRSSIIIIISNYNIFLSTIICLEVFYLLLLSHHTENFRAQPKYVARSSG